jgi:predicted ATPase
MSNHLFVITGGPGSGKSSLIQALANAGLRHMPEAGRAIIQDQVSIGGSALPWSDRRAFAELMLGWELRSHREARAVPGPVICDRGIPDIVGYLTLCGLPVPDHVQRAAELFRYHRTVFIAPHWPEIFSQDAERKQDAKEAAATCRMMAEIYPKFGYDLVHLPLASIAERAAFVQAYIANLGCMP